MLDNSGLIIILNMSGWLIVGYLVRDYFQETKKIKQQLSTTLDAYNALKVQVQLQQQRLEYLEESVTHITDAVDRIQDTLEENNRVLIQELREELRNSKR